MDPGCRTPASSPEHCHRRRRYYCSSYHHRHLHECMNGNLVRCFLVRIRCFQTAKNLKPTRLCFARPLSASVLKSIAVTTRRLRLIAKDTEQTRVLYFFLYDDGLMVRKKTGGYMDLQVVPETGFCWSISVSAWGSSTSTRGGFSWASSCSAFGGFSSGASSALGGFSSAHGKRKQTGD